MVSTPTILSKWKNERIFLCVRCGWKILNWFNFGSGSELVQFFDRPHFLTRPAVSRHAQQLVDTPNS